MEASRKQKELLAKLHCTYKKPSDFDGYNSIEAHILIDKMLSESRKKRNYSEYFALEKQLHLAGYEFARSELIKIHTHGNKSGLRDLTGREYYSLLEFMRSKLEEMEDPALVNMRKKIISRMRTMGYEKNDKADMKAIYTWVKKYGMHHKPLNRHSKEELISLTTQVNLMYDKHLEEVHK